MKVRLYLVNMHLTAQCSQVAAQISNYFNILLYNNYKNNKILILVILRYEMRKILK